MLVQRQITHFQFVMWRPTSYTWFIHVSTFTITKLRYITLQVVIIFFNIIIGKWYIHNYESTIGTSIVYRHGVCYILLPNKLFQWPFVGRYIYKTILRNARKWYLKYMNHFILFLQFCYCLSNVMLPFQMTSGQFLEDMLVGRFFLSGSGAWQV